MRNLFFQAPNAQSFFTAPNAQSFFFSKHDYTNNLQKSQATASSFEVILRRLDQVRENSQFSGDCIQFEVILRRLDQVRGRSQATASSSRKTSGNWTKFEETITTLLMILYYNLYLILHTFAHILHHVEVGGMWKHLVFPWKYFYKHSSKQL